ncbi:MAG TPA: rhomboid family intramembrane serine protease [Solirubrobacteraceae bacterium]|jgi:membrane associated rhomboid family serine protease|nr:rhomboid family intramembrane serine protease [Solirubrobacteraceae bacterium]
MATCYRHPSRETGVSCSNCGRPICPDCMTSTPVGMRCPECSRQRTTVKRLRNVAAVPRVTYALIAINVIVFLTEQGQFTVFGTSIHGKVIVEGVLYREAIAVAHQYWRLVTAGFLHENLLHIGFNMYLLYLLGLMLEPAIGSARFAAIYFTSLLVGSFGALLATAAPSLGASGAIFGLMGAAAVELRSRGFSVMQSGIGGLIILNLVLSFSLANISVGAHIGGLIGGAIAAFAVKAADRRRVPLLGFLACLLISAVAVAAAIAVSKASGTGFA